MKVVICVWQMQKNIQTLPKYFEKVKVPSAYTHLSQILLYGDLPKNKENIIYLANHQSTVDWIIADILAIRQNALGHVRYVLKDGLKWLPLYGCYFSQHGGIYVKRSAKFNEKDMRNKLQSYMNAGTPVRSFPLLLFSLSILSF
nr:1-acyl-sn-glycerol-3-phosphate acyltransferase epsilon isoform X2 [Mirounga angustirostris]